MSPDVPSTTQYRHRTRTFFRPVIILSSNLTELYLFISFRARIPSPNNIQSRTWPVVYTHLDEQQSSSRCLFRHAQFDFIRLGVEYDQIKNLSTEENV